MFIITARLTRNKLAGAVLAGGLLLCAFIILLANRRNAPPHYARLETNSDRVGYLSSLGWKTESEPAEEKEVAIPEDFGSVYENYNALQLRQGFDLSKYRGKTVMQYTYGILNYPGGGDKIYACLLILDGRLIGGDIHSSQLDGFMRGLKKTG